MKQYLDLLQHIMDYGTDRMDRTGVGTRSVFGYQMRFDLSQGFPAVTTKKLAWKPVVSELLWFLEGSGDERRLAEILYGKPREELTNKTTIWTANAQADYWKPKAKFDGDLGRVYGKQWRFWQSPEHEVFEGPISDSEPVDTGWYQVGHKTRVYTSKVIDQIDTLIEGIKKDPFGRRHIVTAWNPGELDQMALPPCHCFSQFYVADGKLSCQMYQRSCDTFLGASFNIASYSLLTHMVAQVCGLKVGEFIHSIGDAHIYLNHFEAVTEQLKRDLRPLPQLWINPEIDHIGAFSIDDFRLVDYDPHPVIYAPMAV